MKKRVLSLILALVMVIGIFPVNVLAAEADELTQAPQTVAIETSLDAEMTDGVFTTAKNPLAVKVRAAADGETVEHTAKLDGEVLEGTPEEDGWTTYVLSFAQSGSYTLDISAADEEQSRTIVYQAQAAADEADENAQINARSNGADTPVSKTQIGSVHVIVENHITGTYYGEFWMNDVTEDQKWTGVRVNDESVPLYDDSTAMSLVVDAVNRLDGVHTIYGDAEKKTAPVDFIDAIDGLKGFSDASGYGGWMVTLNDWFTYEGLNSYSVANGSLRDGDEIRVMYSLSSVPNGSDDKDATKTLSELSATGAELNPSFNKNRKEYELVVGESGSAMVKLTPTATNKNFIARVFKGSITAEQAESLTNTSWFDKENAGVSGASLVYYNESITVSTGDVLTVVVGAPNWPSMSNGSGNADAENVPAGIYTIRVVAAGTDYGGGFADFFTALSGVATAVNDTEYPLRVDADENALVSTNAGKGNSDSGLTLTFSKTAKLTFKFKTSGESYDYLNIEKNKISLVNWQNKSDFGGEMTAYRNTLWRYRRATLSGWATTRTMMVMREATASG